MKTASTGCFFNLVETESGRCFLAVLRTEKKPGKKSDILRGRKLSSSASLLLRPISLQIFPRMNNTIPENPISSIENLRGSPYAWVRNLQNQGGSLKKIGRAHV